MINQTDSLKQVTYLSQQIANAKDAVTEAERNIELLKKYKSARKDWNIEHSWKPNLILKRSDGSFGSRDVTVPINIPYGVVQQQLAYALGAAKRRLVKLEDEARLLLR